MAASACISTFATSFSMTADVPLVLGLGGIGGGLMGVASQSLILPAVADDVRARTLASMEVARNVAFGLGVVGAGVLVDLLGPRPVYAAVGAAMLVGTLPVAALVARLGGPRPLRPLALAT